jgi:predicted AAA+ superfamily ATPase
MQRMLRRRHATLLKERLSHSPAVALLGPRQCGKTTLARSLRGLYFDLEHEPDRVRLDLQWDELQAGRKLLILDEAQTWPAIFPRLRTAIDRHRSLKGRFLLLGSVSPSLMREVSESLAGRMALIELTPFLFNEVPTPSLTRLWRRGGFPDGGVLDKGAKSYPHWHRDYVTLLAQRDLPAWGLPAKPQVTLRLMRMLAVLHAQVWNASQVGQSMGLSYHTVNSYLDFLQGAYLIRRLSPYSANFGARLTKSPKVYWRDSGLLHSLLGALDNDSFLSQPWLGASWEGFVVEQTLGLFEQRGLQVGAYYLRTSDQREIDLVLDLGSRLWAIEIKLTSSPSQSDMEKLNRHADLIKADKRILISRTAQNTSNGRQISCNLKWLARAVEGL